MFQPDPQIHMRTDVQARGFVLTAALRCAVEHEAQEYAERFPEVPTGIQVRLFDVNGRRGGLDKGCLYRAIPAAFAKLDRGTRSILGRRHACRRAQR
jgi:hypothetical protein